LKHYFLQVDPLAVDPNFEAKLIAPIVAELGAALAKCALRPGSCSSCCLDICKHLSSSRGADGLAA